VTGTALVVSGALGTPASGTLTNCSGLPVGGITQNTARLLGRTTASAGATEEITVGSGLSLSAGALTASAGAWTLLSTVTATGASTADIETTFSSAYDNYMIVASRVRPGTTADNLWCRMKLGGAYASGSTDYTYAVANIVSTTYAGSRVNGGPQILIATDLSNGQESIFHFFLANPDGTTYKKSCAWNGAFARNTSGSTDELVIGAGSSEAVTALTGIRFMASTGTITGVFRLYGIANS